LHSCADGYGLFRPDGTGARRITSAVIRGLCLNDSTSAQSCGPRWSPDGRKLYYLAAR
jgi:Tol biopolymer transport system component